MLTPEEIETYHRDGYVTPQDFRLGDSELNKLRDAVDRVLVDNPETLPDRMINTHLDGGAPMAFEARRRSMISPAIHVSLIWRRR